MKLQLAGGFLITASLVAANRHGHVRRHLHIKGKSVQVSSTSCAPEAVETVFVYVLNGQPICEEEVRQGITNGTLSYKDPLMQTPTAAHVVIKTATQASQGTIQPTTADEHISLSSSAVPRSSAAQPPESSGPFPTGLAGLVDANGYCATCDKKFPNGKISCNEFPYGYGALPIANEGLGGWSGIQDPMYRGSDGFDDIVTAAKSSCAEGSCCLPGSYCSYGCPNPYLKLSFPTKQGRTGQTVGGLYCNDKGFLEMADGAIGSTLCGETSKNMIVKVQNKLSKSVSICRTDYPGTESMTFPLTVGPGETGFLANPDQSRYFFWDGQKTSAHYYVNKQGVPENEACTWGAPLQGKGNWSPTIFGTSFDDTVMKTGFSSLKQNELAKSERLNYDITFTGDGIAAPCRYISSTDHYCQGDDCWTDKDRGCTASVKPGGTLILVLSDG